MALFGAILCEQRLAFFHKLVVQTENLGWPRRRLQLDDLLLECLQAGEIYRIVVVEDRRRDHAKTRQCGHRLEVGKYAENLAGIAPQAVDQKPVLHGTVPLGTVLARGIPQERIADGSVGDLKIAGEVEVVPGDAIEDHAEGVEPTGPPWRWRQARVHESTETIDPFAEGLLQA